MKKHKSTIYRQPKLIRRHRRGLSEKQIFATSKDGNRVPSLSATKRGCVLDGTPTAPTADVLRKGRSNISLMRSFAPSPRDCGWRWGGISRPGQHARRGSTARHGHEDGTRVRKPKRFDDFISSPSRLWQIGTPLRQKLAIRAAVTAAFWWMRANCSGPIFLARSGAGRVMDSSVR